MASDHLGCVRRACHRGHLKQNLKVAGWTVGVDTVRLQSASKGGCVDDEAARGLCSFSIGAGQKEHFSRVTGIADERDGRKGVAGAPSTYSWDVGCLLARLQSLVADDFKIQSLVMRKLKVLMTGEQLAPGIGLWAA